MATPETLSNRELRDRFEGEREFAVIDVREAGDFARGHLLAASNLPMSHLELAVQAAIPNRSTEIVLCDLATAGRAVHPLRLLGYRNVKVLSGGVTGWALDGGKLFSGTNVIGKAFGEYIEKIRQTPAIGAPDLKQLLDSDRPPLLLDTRTPEEHTAYCIPGAVSCPNGELVYRALASIDSDDQLIVTHCAGRTRSIIGAQALIDAGVRNAVVALENGTLAWQFETYELEVGANRPLPMPGVDGARVSLEAAQRLRDRFGVTTIDLDTLTQWRSGAEESCVYVYDVRSAEEYAAGTLADARHVPGGQLVQNVDDYLVTRNARIALVDTDGVRASATAAWLTQLGYRHVHPLTVPTDALEPLDTEADTVLDLPRVQPSAAAGEVACGEALFVDIRRSVDYRRGHVPDSWYLNRGRIDEDVRRLPQTMPVYLVADDHRYASLLATDLGRHGRQVKLVTGGFNGWCKTGLPIESGLNRLASEPNDMAFDVEDFDDLATQLREGRAYLEWEIGLVHQLENDPGAPYMKAVTEESQ